MNAYELAEYLDNNVEAMIMSEQPHLDNAANMLRQQADRIAELEAWTKPSGFFNASEPIYPPQTKPLTDEEIATIWVNYGVPVVGTVFMDVVRAIEERHGIK